MHLTDSYAETEDGLGSRLGKRRMLDGGRRQATMRSVDGMIGIDSNKKKKSSFST